MPLLIEERLHLVRRREVRDERRIEALGEHRDASVEVEAESPDRVRLQRIDREDHRQLARRHPGIHPTEHSEPVDQVAHGALAVPHRAGGDQVSGARRDPPGCREHRRVRPGGPGRRGSTTSRATECEGDVDVGTHGHEFVTQPFTVPVDRGGIEGNKTMYPRDIT